jgi:hypothetical protein
MRAPDGEIMYSEARIVPSAEDEFVMIVRDVTHERLTETRSEALLEALPDSMFRLTRDGRYLDFRARDAQHYHYQVHGPSFIGTSIRDALPPDVAEGVMAAAERAFESGEMQTVQGQMEHEGEAVYAEARVMPSGENEFVMIVRDVTERFLQEQQIHTPSRCASWPATSSTRSTGATSGRSSSRPRTVLPQSASSEKWSAARTPASSRAAG